MPPSPSLASVPPGPSTARGPGQLGPNLQASGQVHAMAPEQTRILRLGQAMASSKLVCWLQSYALRDRPTTRDDTCG